MASESKLYKVGDVADVAGKYQCIVCAHIIEMKVGDKFEVCPVCQAGSEGGPKGPEEGFWQLLG